MFCTNCGQEVEEGTKFCTNCGAALTSQPTPSESQPETPVAQAEAPVVQQAGNPAGNGTQPNGGLAGVLVRLAVVVVAILLVVNFGGALLGKKGGQTEVAEKKVISIVTSDYEKIPTVKSKVLKKVDDHVLVVVTYEVDVSGTTFDGSYLLDIYGRNQIVRKISKELPIDYDYEASLDEIMAIWGI